MNTRFTGHTHTTSTRERISAKLRGTKRTPATRAAISATRQLRRARIPWPANDYQWDSVFNDALKRINIYDRALSLAAKELAQ